MVALVTACSSAVEGTAVAPPGAARPRVTHEPIQDPPAPSTPSTPAPQVGTWGQKFTWENGISVEVAPPVVCKPGPYASPQKPPRAVLVTMKIVNDSSQAFETTGLTFGADVQFAGAKAETLFDSTGACKSSLGQPATVLPGKTYTHSSAYAVPAQPGEMQISLQPEYRAVKAICVGQV